MYHTPTKRRKRVQLTFIYMLMVLSIVSIVFVLILVVQGYRYNSYDGKVEQGGLVQFDSRPSGATVSVDDITLSARTASKITLSSGRHTVKMTRDGYSTWQKNVSVTPGGVLCGCCRVSYRFRERPNTKVSPMHRPAPMPKKYSSSLLLRRRRLQ